MTRPAPQVGDDVFHHEPQRIVAGCVSITGPIIAISDGICTVDATIAYRTTRTRRRLTLPLTDLDRRFGTPFRRRT